MTSNPHPNPVGSRSRVNNMGGTYTQETEKPNSRHGQQTGNENHEHAERKVSKGHPPGPTRSRQPNRLSSRVYNIRRWRTRLGPGTDGTDQRNRRTRKRSTSSGKSASTRRWPFTAQCKWHEEEGSDPYGTCTKKQRRAAVHLRCRTERLACIRHRPPKPTVSMSTQKPRQQRIITTTRRGQGQSGRGRDEACVKKWQAGGCPEPVYRIGRHRGSTTSTR